MPPSEPVAAVSAVPLVDHNVMANAIRALSMDAVEAAKSGHPGMPMGAADIATVLFRHFLKFDPTRPTWPDRDRFVLSAGHASALLYSVLYLTGYEKMTMAELRRFRQLKSLTPGHPELDPGMGVETTTGPLGQGLGNAVGMALAERILNHRFGDALVDHRTFVIASDGDIMEGVSHEAASIAGHLNLDRLIVLYDDNEISIDGPTALTMGDDTAARFRAYGWFATRIDGQDPDAIAAAISEAQTAGRPSLICCRTTIAYGAPTKAGSETSHGAPLGAEEVAGARASLGWHHPPFEVPESVLMAWRAAGQRGAPARAAWEQRLTAADPGRRAAFQTALAGTLPEGLDALIAEYKQTAAAKPRKLATRQASGEVLEKLIPAVPELIGGSADLTPSNNTRTKGMVDIAAGRYSGRYIRYGVREFGMATVMTGLALHGGLIPYGASFLTFSDYAGPAIRLAALMRQRVIYVMTHDSIGLGEDGPTHQPIEHLTWLRSMPGIQVFRPADPLEVAECWQLALHAACPSVLALTRQTVDQLRTSDSAENLCAHGAYILAEAAAPHRVTLFATGSEVAIAIAARARLEAEGIGARVVSMPCWELFEQQDEAYKASLLDDGTVKVAIEAAIRHGWDRYIGRNGIFIGMPGFGASAPHPDLYAYFGITAEAAAAAAKARLQESSPA